MWSAYGIHEDVSRSVMPLLPRADPSGHWGGNDQDLEVPPDYNC